MASVIILRDILCVPHYPVSHRQQNPPVYPSQFLSSESFSRLRKQSPIVTLQVKRLDNHKVLAVQSNFFKVLQTVVKVGKDGIEAGTNLVPDSVPRPIARISVTVVAVSLALFVLKSVLSTAFFVVAMMGLIYFTFLAFNKDEGPKGGGGGGGGGGGTTSVENSLEEARRIMEKYK